MTTHQRNFPSIDPQKLDRLAETAVKVGLRLAAGAGPLPHRAGRRAAARAARSSPRLTRRARGW